MTRASLVESARKSRKQVDDLVSAQYQLAFAAGGLELHETLAQQHKQQADVVGEAPSVHQAGQFGVAVAFFLAAEVGVALGVVDDDVDADGGEMVPHRRAVSFAASAQVSSSVSR